MGTKYIYVDGPYSDWDRPYKKDNELEVYADNPREAAELVQELVNTLFGMEVDEAQDWDTTPVVIEGWKFRASFSRKSLPLARSIK